MGHGEGFGLLAGTAQIGAGGAVQHIVVPGGGVNAQISGIGIQHLPDLFSSVFLAGSGVLEVVEELGVVLKDLLHLGIELVHVEPGHRVDQEGPHHRHQRDDEQCHDEHELHMKAAEHGAAPFHREKIL